MSSKAVFVGTAEDIVSSAEKWFESGVDQVNFIMPHDAGYAQRLCEAMANVRILDLGSRAMLDVIWSRKSRSSPGGPSR